MTREEAINKVRRMSLPKETMDILEELVPELAMSEDERMINELQGFLLSFGSDYFGTGEWQKFDDWLEKQKEQKPKFYPGDVIKCTSTGSLWVRCKDGDNIRSDGHTACIGGGYELASKEEAVQFFQELNENGYQWDCIKGRPMKKEQKPEQYDIDVLEKHITKDSISELAHTVIVRNGWEIVEAEQKPAEWNKATVNGGPIPPENQSIDIPLAEWSDEDADMLNCCISSIEEAKENRYAYKETDGDTSYDREIDWLKSLRPSWKPSEQEKGALRTAIYVLREERNFPKAAGHLQAILDAFEGKESRKDWKPSEKQMRYLLAVINDPNNIGAESCYLTIKSLYNDLKKLT